MISQNSVLVALKLARVQGALADPADRTQVSRITSAMIAWILDIMLNDGCRDKDERLDFLQGVSAWFRILQATKEDSTEHMDITISFVTIDRKE